MSFFYFFSQKVSEKLIQNSVLVHRTSLHNKVIQITYSKIPEVSMFPKESYFLPFLFVCRYVEDGERKISRTCARSNWT